MTPVTRLLPLLASLVLAACASDPPVRFHSLQPEPVAAPPAPARAVDLAPVGVPASVDQPQWVVRLADGSLRLLEQERWVAPLRDEVRAALLAGLRDRHGIADVRLLAPPAPAAPRVRFDVTRFETVAGQGAWVSARWTVTPAAGGTGKACEARVEQAAPADPLALADAHRRALALMADRLAASLTSEGCGAPG